MDVRLDPVSRKHGLSKTALREALCAVGIAYLHESMLGNPKENRAGFHNGDLVQARENFRARLSSGSHDALQELAILAAHSIAALLCFERDEGRCHRQVVVEELQGLDPALMTVPLS